MNLPERLGVSESKRTALLGRMKRLGIDLGAITERHVKGGGPGGSKINTTANCVVLVHPPTGHTVRCQRDRRLSVNRFLALRELVDRIEEVVSPATSARLRDVDRRRRNRNRRKRRARRKKLEAGG